MHHTLNFCLEQPGRNVKSSSLNYIDVNQFFVYLLVNCCSEGEVGGPLPWYNESVLRSYCLLYILWLPTQETCWCESSPNKEGLLDSYRCTFWWYHVGCPCLWLAAAGWWFGEPAARVSLSFSQHPSTTPIYSCGQDRENLEQQSKCDPLIFSPGFLQDGTESFWLRFSFNFLFQNRNKTCLPY